jgi:5-methylthioribose kinase
VNELAGGVSSTILKIEAQSGTYCLKQALPLLKVAQLWSAPVNRVYAEIAWLQLVARIEPKCVPKVLGVDRPTNSFAMSFLPPHDFPNWKSQLISGKVDCAFAASVGATLARIHGQTANCDEMKQKFANDDNFLALRLDPYFLESAKKHPDLATALHSLIADIRTRKVALVHGDISPKNILVGADGPVFLDAECALYGEPAFDAAFCLNHLLLKSIAVHDRSGCFLRAFDALGEGYLCGVDWEPQRDLESRIARLLPALTLARISGKSPVGYLDENAREQTINITKRLVAKPATRLAEIRDLWKKGFDL